MEGCDESASSCDWNFGIPESSTDSHDFWNSEKHESRKYCICRSNDVDRFMICCDNCEEWYHGDCIGVTERSSKDIIVFYCETCKIINPRLLTVHRTNENGKANSRRNSAVSKAKPKRNKPKNRLRTKFTFKKPKQKAAQKCQINETSVVKSEDIETEVCDSNFDADENIELCDEIKKIQVDDYFEVFAEPDYELSPDVADDIRRINEGIEKFEKIVSEKGLRKGNDAKIDAVVFEEAAVDVEETPREEVFLDKLDDFDSCFRKAKAKALSNILSSGKHESKKMKLSEESSTVTAKKPPTKTKKAAVQCLGPECVKAARPKSKYCSEECGEKLASNRLFEILPQRINQWKTLPCAADENNRISLNSIRQKKLEIQRQTAAVEAKIGMLNELIHEARNTPHKSVIIKDIDEDDYTVMDCKLCGIEIMTKTAVKHMENCYKKRDSLTIEAERSPAPLDTSLNIFCNAVIGHQTYCKKLRVLCPLHCKENKIENDVCGYPLMKNVTEYSDRFCGQLRAKCGKHMGWESLFRAQLDMDRLRLLFKFSELEAKEIEIRTAMANRGGVLALLLHQTFVH